MLQVTEWFLLPRIFKIENPSDATWQNRLYVLEQVANQDAVDLAFDDWGSVPSLANNQTVEPTGITGPGGIPQGVYLLGSQANTPLAGAGGGCGGSVEALQRRMRRRNGGRQVSFAPTSLQSAMT